VNVPAAVNLAGVVKALSVLRVVIAAIVAIAVTSVIAATVAKVVNLMIKNALTSFR
jgi:hypothetical protein